MKKILDKLKSWMGNKSDKLTFDDVTFTGSLFTFLTKWWHILRNCFWNAVQAVYNIRKLINNLRDAGATL